MLFPNHFDPYNAVWLMLVFCKSWRGSGTGGPMVPGYMYMYTRETVCDNTMEDCICGKYGNMYNRSRREEAENESENFERCMDEKVYS